MRNHPIQNRQYNRGRLLMKISPQLGIRKITAGAGGGSEVMRTFSVMNVQNCSTDGVTESVTAWASSDSQCPSDEHSKKFGRPVTEAMTAGAGSDADISRDECSDLFDRPVTESVTAWARSDTDFTSEEDFEFFSRPVTESMTARAGNDTDYPSGEHLEFGTDRSRSR